jgi:putative ABC transport system permease protein
MVSESGFTMQRWKIDYDYLKTLGIKLIKGRNFSPGFGSDSLSLIINEAAEKQLGYKDPLNEKLYTWVGGGRLVSYNIIGVVKNFHFESFHQDIGPLCFVHGRNNDLASFKINAAQTPNILKGAEVIWKRMASGMPFSYKFMDDSFSEVYKAEQQVGTLALSFSILAIFIACLGLFGLATFLAEQKTKEIGVRKVLGASVPSILLMLSKEFIKWIVIANIIAWPLAYYFMNKWLQEFAYRIEIGWWIFALSGIIAIIIALLTVSFQALKAATANPIKSLRYE